MKPITPAGEERSLRVNLTGLLQRLQTVPAQRKRRGVRYWLAVLLAIAVLAKLCGQSQVHALAGLTNARPNEASDRSRWLDTPQTIPVAKRSGIHLLMAYQVDK